MNPDEKPVHPFTDTGIPGAAESPGARTPEGTFTRSGVWIATVRGIRFYLDYSWFFIAILLTWMLSRSVFPQLVPGHSRLEYLGLGLAASILFFLSILLHELGHSIVSQRSGIPVPRITLFFLGGVAEISREPERPGQELKIALGGPAVSLLLVAGFGLTAYALSFWTGGAALRVLFLWLAQINLVLVIFNAVPAYPLDGGRVLRALIWMVRDDLLFATRVASRIGVGFGFFLIVMGVLLTLRGMWNGLLLLLIGLFVRNAADSGYLHVLQREALAGLKARDLIAPGPEPLNSRISLNLAVDDYFTARGWESFPVVDDEGRFLGFLSLAQVKAVGKSKWPYTTARELLQPAGSDCVTPDTDAREVLISVQQSPYRMIAVVDREHRLNGIICLYQIMRKIEISLTLRDD